LTDTNQICQLSPSDAGVSKYFTLMNIVINKRTEDHARSYDPPHSLRGSTGSTSIRFFVVIAITSGVEKLEWVATMQMVKKFDDMFSCLDTTLACVRPTDGRRDILRQQNHRISR